ncbi:MAG TPA: RNA methyltransferase [Prolixibacteraceae bacterium]|nr:RNA methyltransferase [Prolixibacteraceae bacterium]
MEKNEHPKRNLPEAFTERLNVDLENEAPELIKALSDESPVSIRYNPAKQSKTIDLEKVPWCETGYYLPERPVFTLDPLFHAGVYYVQEASSMFLEEILRQNIDLSKALKVLDLCGAPGGKSTHLASLISSDSLLVANEVIRPRAKILAENLTKWGYPNVVVTNNDPADFQRLPGFFDLLVIDAPCSGEGMFRKDPRAIEEWSEANVQHCSVRQRRIVADAWSCLKEGGLLVYSTCTFNRIENDENLQWIIRECKGEPVFSDLKRFPEIMPAGNLPGYRFYPHRVKGEGFFLSLFRKNQKHDSGQIKPGKKSLQKCDKSIRSNVQEWLKEKMSFEFFRFNDQVLAFPGPQVNDLIAIIGRMSIVQAGTEMAEVKARNLIPAQALAFSICLEKERFPSIELDRSEALRFLRKEDIRPPGNEPFLRASFENTPLGFLKRAGNRYNNLYPKEWRIRMDE